MTLSLKIVLCFALVLSPLIAQNPDTTFTDISFSQPYSADELAEYALSLDSSNPDQMRAFTHAARVYRDGDEFSEAAAIMIHAAESVTNTPFSISALAKAAADYDTLGEYETAAKLYHSIFEKYPTAEQAPTALYNAGLLYEKAELFESAIEVYRHLNDQYPESRYSFEGCYSVGFCYQKMGREEEMANAFVDFAESYTADRFKQTHALLIAAKAYENLGDREKANRYFLLGTKIFERYGERDSIPQKVVAEHYYRLAELKRQEHDSIEIIGSDSVMVQSQEDKKVEALKTVFELYKQSIGTAAQEWIYRSLYGCALTYVNYIESLRNKTLFGSPEDKIVSKIELLVGLEEHYDITQEMLALIIQRSIEENYVDEVIHHSKALYCEMGFRRGMNVEEIGVFFRDTPIPNTLPSDEKRKYEEAFEDKYSSLLDTALIKYETILQSVADLSIEENQWCDSVRTRIEYIENYRMN